MSWASPAKREYRRIENMVRGVAPAMRYRYDKDATGMLCETHVALPADPPADRRTLVLFAHYDAQGIVDPYVVYYLEALNRVGATIIFVSGSAHLDPQSVEAIRPLCAGVFTRQTLALDFGSWHLAWTILQEHGWSLQQFDRFVLANDSVYGPLFPLEEMWNSFEGADMYGAIESAETVSHVQSFFLVWDLNSRTRPFLEDFWRDFRYLVIKTRLIRKYEVGMSERARKAGLSIKPFASVERIRGSYDLSPTHQWAAKFARGPFNNTLYYWDGLIEHLRFPFLKAVLPRTGLPRHRSMGDLPQFIAAHTTYPYELIGDNLDRLGCAPLRGSGDTA